MNIKKFCLLLILIGLFIGIYFTNSYNNKCKIKGNTSSKIYHTEHSPYYKFVKDYICFNNVSQAHESNFKPPKVLSY